MFSNCLYFFNSRDNNHHEKQPLLEKEFKPIQIVETKPIQIVEPKQIEEQTITISEPVFDIGVVNKLDFDKMTDYRSFLLKYGIYKMNNHEHLNRKCQVLNFLDIFRILYKTLLISQNFVIIQNLKDKYEYCYSEYKSINDENIFPTKIIKEMELISNAF